jgi:UDP-GlcNAc:undecaprenyl-phosphate GlcNAc-1-phosphate transferase
MVKIYLFCIITSFVFSLIFVPISNWLAKKFNIYDKPSKRKMNFRKLTRWGGFGMFISFFLTIFLLLKIFPQAKNVFSYKYSLEWGEIKETFVLSKQLLGIFFASILVIVVGTVDDKKGINPLTKFLFQIIIAYCAMDFGVRILGFTIPFKDSFVLLPRILSQVVTILWLCGFMNMVNLADGVDGLAAGIISIAGFTFFVISILQRQTGVVAQQMVLSAVLSCILVGVSSGFLVYNFFPAKLYMGDTGALWLGFIIGCITTVGVLKTGAIISFVIPIFVVAMPFLDVIVSIIRRIKKGVNIGVADKEHIHHLLLSSGWTEREVVLFFYVITMFLSMLMITFVALKFR